jgi:DNA-binding phage protein
MSAHEVIRNAVNEHVKDAKQAAKISDAVFTSLDVGGWLTTDNDHLAMLRSMQQVIRKAMLSEDTATKDISPLTRRLQDVSREVTTLEERQNQEGRSKRGKPDDDGTAGSTAFDPSTI